MGFKQKELAEKAPMSPDTLSALENGKSVTVETLARVLNARGYSDALINLLPAPVISPIDL